jgi:hypothetical protein
MTTMNDAAIKLGGSALACKDFFHFTDCDINDELRDLGWIAGAFGMLGHGESMPQLTRGFHPSSRAPQFSEGLDNGPPIV